MKLKITLGAICLATLFASSPLNAQIPNGDFENWTDLFVFEEPDSFASTNMQSWALVDSANVTRIPRGGGSAIRVQTTDNGQDTLIGMAKIGEFVAPASYLGGYAHQGPTIGLSLCEWHKVEPGDTAFLILAFKNGGSLVNLATFDFVGQTSGFNCIQTGIPNPQASDTLVVLIQSSSRHVHAPGSWFAVDSIYLTSNGAPIPNRNFEFWTDYTIDEPDQWLTQNIFSVGQGLFVEQVAGHSGDYAARITTRLNDGDTFGTMTNGWYGAHGLGGGAPYDQKHDSFVGYYRYFPVGPDSAYVRFFAKKYNTGTGHNDTLAFFESRLGGAATWTRFALPITWKGQKKPDTLQLIFAPSAYNGVPAGVGSALELDDLGMTFGTSGLPEVIAAEVHLFPNPASADAYFNWPVIGDIVTVELFNISGQLVSTQQIRTSGGQDSIAIPESRQAMYLYRLRSGHGSATGRLMLN